MRSALVAGTLVGWVLGAPFLHAGGSGLNVAVIVNQSSSNSCELGNYYCEKRQVAPENLLRINWPGPNTLWTNTEFQTNLLSPLLDMLTSRQLTNQIEYVVVCMDIPFQTANVDVVNGTSSALFYGLKTETGPAWVNITNSYYASESPFSENRPASAPGPSFLATLITSDSLDAARRLIDHGVASDGMFPTQPVILAKTSDPARNFRFHFFDNAIFNVRLTGGAILRTNTDSFYGFADVMGLEMGLTQFSMSPNSFVPGAIADNVTSFSGIIFGPNDQTTALALINAGASGSYGTVTEPSPVAEKFPNPQAYFYQVRGFNIAEAYYQSLFEPYEGIVVAEPLAAPFARRGAGSWTGISSNAVLSSNAQLTCNFTAADPTRPLQRVDLFVDGKFFRTVTNVAPSAGNVLKLHLNGNPIMYTVPANATVGSVAADLAGLINAPAATNAAKALAYLHGDRIELHSLSTNHPAPPRRLRPRSAGGANPAVSNLPLVITNSGGTAKTLTTFLRSSRPMFLNSPAAGNKAFTISGSTQVGSWLSLTVRKVTGTTVTVSATNQSITASPYDLAAQLVSQINSNSALQDTDGVFAEDLRPGFFGAGSFLLRSGSPGLKGAATLVTFKAAANLLVSPTNQVRLDDNLLDAQPRNHLYVTAGVTNLTATFALDTTGLSDGYHDLTAVAYEGSHVRTQTRLDLPVVVRNTGLTATLTPVDLVATNPIQGVYHVQISANATNVLAIHLFSTGGELAGATNQSSATLPVNGTALGAGLHPFYALVETSTGGKFRTATFWARLVY